MFGDSKIILQYNGKELTVRNTEIDMNFVNKACQKSNRELQVPRMCLHGNSPSCNGFVYRFMACIFVPRLSKGLSQSSLVPTKKTAVSWLDFSASFRRRLIVDIVLVWGN